MKIIREGDPGRADTIRRFECPVCGCVWECNAAEYRRTPNITSAGQVLQFRYKCHCPCCHYGTVQFENTVGGDRDGADQA